MLSISERVGLVVRSVLAESLGRAMRCSLVAAAVLPFLRLTHAFLCQERVRR